MCGDSLNVFGETILQSCLRLSAALATESFGSWISRCALWTALFECDSQRSLVWKEEIEHCVGVVGGCAQDLRVPKRSGRPYTPYLHTLRLFSHVHCVFLKHKSTLIVEVPKGCNLEVRNFKVIC